MEHGHFSSNSPYNIQASRNGYSDRDPMQPRETQAISKNPFAGNSFSSLGYQQNPTLQINRPPNHVRSYEPKLLYTRTPEAAPEQASRLLPILPTHPNYQTQQSRETTYIGYQQNFSHNTPEELADAGFLYRGNSLDGVSCFHCDQGIKNWEEGDSPWVEHARWLKKCEFVEKEMGYCVYSSYQSYVRRRRAG